MADGTARTDGAAEPVDLSRRVFLRGAGGAAAGGVLAPALLGAAAGGCAAGATAGAGAATSAALAAPPGADPAGRELVGEVEIELAINGTRQKLVVEPRTTLLDALRTRLEPPLTGTKSVCERGNCGACTVLVDGEPRYACLQLACDLRGRAITTVEGLGSPEKLSVLQQEFVAQDGSMCGFCTPGFVVAITACLQRDPRASEQEIRRACAGNLCRCGTHPQVFAAALAAGRRLAEGQR
ncbi:MAG: (2Fe-2S)-binding protein [Planctomycetes bacterium]|nr:(2Fe-2S)-binding protein [Planctomycetota bacterium]